MSNQSETELDTASQVLEQQAKAESEWSTVAHLVPYSYLHLLYYSIKEISWTVFVNMLTDQVKVKKTDNSMMASLSRLLLAINWLGKGRSDNQSQIIIIMKAQVAQEKKELSCFMN